MTEKTNHQILAEIQSEISAPKNRYNDYGNFNYRSYEDIVEAVKPVCTANRTSLIVSDIIEEIGGWHYVTAHATLLFWDGQESITVSASAREAEQKKGSDVSQITGMASTYARKYALCGLFSIDGQDDADAMGNTAQNANNKAEAAKNRAKARLWETLQTEAGRRGLDPMQGIETMKSWSGYEDTESYYDTIVKMFEHDNTAIMARLYPNIEEVK